MNLDKFTARRYSFSRKKIYAWLVVTIISLLCVGGILFIITAIKQDAIDDLVAYEEQLIKEVAVLGRLKKESTSLEELHQGQQLKLTKIDKLSDITRNTPYHFLLEVPVAYEVQLNQSANFIFLTGANMAGKSTFIKAAGLAAYMAHIGMGVPAKKMKLSRLDGILSNIQVSDNILKGESFFFNEVQRIKKTIERISDGKKWLILIDELFKGTNQEDAVKCSTVVIEGLRKLPNALFILSTHLYEIGHNLKHHPNIQFRYFETAVNNDQLVFSYQLKEGISNDRLGFLILKREGVVSMLENL